MARSRTSKSEVFDAKITIEHLSSFELLAARMRRQVLEGLMHSRQVGQENAKSDEGIALRESHLLGTHRGGPPPAATARIFKGIVPCESIRRNSTVPNAHQLVFQTKKS